MKIEKAINILENHNKWRRGDGTTEMEDVWELGDAIDIVLSKAKMHHKKVSDEELKKSILDIFQNWTFILNEEDYVIEQSSYSNVADRIIILIKEQYE